MIDPTFSKANRLFFLSFKINEDKNKADSRSFSEYYTQSVEMKHFNVSVDGKSFFDVPIKNKEKIYKKNIEMSRNSDYTTGNLLDYDYFSNNYKLIAKDFRKQIELEDPDLKQEINFIVDLKKIMEQQCFLSL